MLQAYRGAYDKDSSAELKNLFGEFETPVNAFDKEDDVVLNDDITRPVVAPEKLPESIRAWEDPDLRVVCWNEQATITKMSVAFSHKNKLLKKELSNPNHDSEDGKVRDEEVQQSRTKELQIADKKIADLDKELKAMNSCPNPTDAGLHNWYVKFPKSGQFTALPLPEKIDKYELYNSRGSEVISEMSEKLGMELYDYEWEFWNDYYANSKK